MDMPRQGPSTAEYRPASPPAASRTMSSGLSHLVMSVSGSAAWTCGVVSPTAQLARRPADGVEHRLAQPLLAPAGGAEHRLVLGADDVDRRPAERPPVRAPRRGAGPAQDVGEVLRRRRAVVGDRQRRVAADDRHDRVLAREPALDVQRLPRAARLVLGDAEAELAGVPQRRSVQPPGRAAAGQRDHQPERASDRQVRPPAGTEHAHPAVQADRLADRAADDHELARGLGRHRLPVEVEGRVERRLHRREDDREVLRAAAGEDRARGDALERRLAHAGRHLAERPLRVAAAEHRVDARAGGGNDRKPVGPPALEHVLHLVGGAGALDQRQHLLVVRRLGRAAGLRARRLVGDLGSRRADRGAGLADERRQRAGVPSDHRPRDRRVAVEQERRRQALERVRARRVVRRRLRQHGALEARVARDAGSDVERVLEDDREADARVAQRRDDRAEPAEGERARRALLGREDQQRRSAGDEVVEPDRTAGRARQLERRGVAQAGGASASPSLSSMRCSPSLTRTA